MDDRDTWSLLVAGDEDAWNDAVVSLYGRVRAFFVNKVGDEADELTQRTFIRLNEVRAGYEGRGSPRSYVMRIAHFILMEYLRERRRNYAAALEDVSMAAIEPRPSSALAARAEQRLVLEALRKLSLGHQIVLELYYWEDMTDREIAEVLDENENTVRSRRGRARERLRELLEALDGQPPPASTSMNLERWARSLRDQLRDGAPR